MTNNAFNCLRLEIDQYVAKITLCRPEQLNAFDNLAHDELHHALEVLKSNSDIRAAIIAAEGKCFSAGGNFEFMREMNQNPKLNRLTAQRATALIETLVSIDVPVIAAVQGDAIGLGASLAFGCDIVVANRSARFADPHVVVGLAAGDGGCVFWSQSAGLHRAKRYVLTGEYLSAEKAYEFGLVSDLTDSAEETASVALKLANKVANLAPLAVQGTKRSFNNLMQARVAETAKIAALQEQLTMSSKDLLEALAAIEEKRKPDFKGY